MTLDIINPVELGKPSGWSNGLLAPRNGRVLFVAGQSATDETGMVPDIGLTDQWARVLDKILIVVRAAGGDAHDIARMTAYVTDRQAYIDHRKALAVIWRERMGRHYPAMALVEVSALVDERAMIEIEATAIIGAD